MLLVYLGKGKKKIQKLETYIENNTNNFLWRDFNMAEKDILTDRAGRNPTTQYFSIGYIDNIKNNNNMVDIWQNQKPQKREYTYFNDLVDFKSRIDRFYLISNTEEWQH